jgi:hypothetical protein
MADSNVKDPPTKIQLGPQLRADLQREVSRLTGEWKAATCANRKRDLQEAIMSLLDLLEEAR